jgi:hypothetical protein
MFGGTLLDAAKRCVRNAVDVELVEVFLLVVLAKG